MQRNTVLYVISARCVARGLHTITQGHLHHHHHHGHHHHHYYYWWWWWWCHCRRCCRRRRRCLYHHHRHHHHHFYFYHTTTTTTTTTVVVVTVVVVVFVVVFVVVVVVIIFIIIIVIIIIAIFISSHLGFVHPLQDVALHQCLPSSSVCCLRNPGGSLLLCYVILPSSAWSSSRPVPSPWLPLCASPCPPIVL